jgi:hypothetical protein
MKKAFQFHLTNSCLDQPSRVEILHVTAHDNYRELVPHPSSHVLSRGTHELGQCHRAASQ